MWEEGGGGGGEGEAGGGGGGTERGELRPRLSAEGEDRARRGARQGGEENGRQGGEENGISCRIIARCVDKSCYCVG